MKICVVSLNIIPYFQSDMRSRFGGAEVQAAFVAEALAHRSHDVSMVVSDLDARVKIPFPTYNAFRSDEGVRGVRFFHPRLSGILRALQAADADVYYQRNAGMITGVTALFCRRHGRVFVYGGGCPVDYSVRTPHVHGVRDKLLYITGLKMASGVVVQNEEQRQVAGRVVNAPIRVIPNGIDSSDMPSDGEHDGVVWVGALRRLKRPEWFIELARRMPDQKFVLIGGVMPGEPSFGRRTLDDAKALPNMEVMGWLGRDETMTYIKRSRVLVNTSKLEGFPNVYLEAWSYGVPVVSVNDVDGLIANNGPGIIVDSLDAMERELAGLLADGERLSRLGEVGRKLVEVRFSVPALSRYYDDFLNELVESNRRAAPAQ